MEDMAIDKLQQCTQLFPSYPEAYQALSHLLYRTKDYKEALKCFEKVEELGGKC